MRLFVLGASGSVGSVLVKQATARGHGVTAQTRKTGTVDDTGTVRVVVGSPDDAAFLTRNLAGHDAVVVCIGVDSLLRTTLFSDTANAVIDAMKATGLRRLVAITGVGAGETRGHGGWFYNLVLYPLFTRNRYADKNRQESIIEHGMLDWTIVRPAPFAARVSSSPLQIHTDIPAKLQLRSITREEVAKFILACLEHHRFIRAKPFIGHP